jgi:hypothetical protein
VVLLAWFFAFGWPRGVARELLGDVPVPGADFPHQPLDILDDEFALATDWNPPESNNRPNLHGENHPFPDLLLRFGLTDRLELRLGWPEYVRGHSGDPALGGWFSGTTDPNVGLAYDLWGQPLTELMYAWQISDRTAVTGRSGLAVLKSDGDRYTQFHQSLSFDVMLTERLALSWRSAAGLNSTAPDFLHVFRFAHRF